jgi:peptide/nickel transport system substrate-binding protein
MRSKKLTTALVAVAIALSLAACGGGGGSADDAHGGSGSAGKPVRGGTLTLLTLRQQLQHLDPQRNYTGEDLAFTSAFLNRTLTAFTLSNDAKTANELTPDLATDTGTASDGARTWAFTLRDGPAFEDGSPITCESIKYGVSRTFATTVLTDGPQYAVDYLDIPKNKDGSSVYKGPYATGANDTAAFDKAVECSADHKTVTFHLANPAPDFNYTVTLSAFAPVPKSADTGERYDDKPVSSGPYKIQEYTKGSQLVLVRNENWSPESDDYRGAYPDKIVMKFGVDSAIIDQRMIQDNGDDQRAASAGDNVEPSSLAQVFGDDRFKDRRADAYDAYSYYYAINVLKVPDLKQRQAMAVALDRAAIRTANGGKYAGDLADGLIKPNLPPDYAESGIWSGLLGQDVPDHGDPEYAKQLIQESGKPMPTIRFDYSQSDTHDKEAAVVVASFGKAGITVKPNPIEPGQYYSIVFDPDRAGELIWGAWGPDWPNASTVIPPVFTPAGGWDLSQVDDAEFNQAVQTAKTELDRGKQASMWQDLNKQAMQNAWAIPTIFHRSQGLAGSKVHVASGEGGNVYLWAPYASWSYPDMYVTQ